MIKVLRRKHTSLFEGIGIHEYNMTSVSLFDIILIVSEDLEVPEQLGKKYTENSFFDISEYVDCSTGSSYAIQDKDRVLILKKPYIICGSRLENELQQIIGQIKNYNKQ